MTDDISISNTELFLFIDLDNTLYSASKGVDSLMVERISNYCIKVLEMSSEDAEKLQDKYFRDYGLAIRGLLKYHNVDPVDYDQYVDGGLPLDELLAPDEQLKLTLKSLPPCSKFVFTNAGKNHAERVIRLLGLKDSGIFQQIIHCNYSDPNFVCKPDESAFIRAMKLAGVRNSFQCALVDDSANNVMAAIRMGWKAILVRETSRPNDPDPSIVPTISTIYDLPSVIHHILPLKLGSSFLDDPLPLNLSTSRNPRDTDEEDNFKYLYLKNE